MAQDAVAAGRKVALITYAHNEPLHSGQMDHAENGLDSIGYGSQSGCHIRRWFGNRDHALTLENAYEILAWEPDVVLSFMTNADLAMLKVTGRKGLPIVCWSMDPVGGGLVMNPDCPEGNLTGVTLCEPLQQAQLNALLMMRPGAKRIGALHNPTYAIAPAALQRLEEVAEQRGVTVTAYECLSAAEITPVFAAMAVDGIDAAVIGPHEVFNGNGAIIADASAAAGVAVVGLQSIPEGGGPAGFGVDFAEVWALAARMAGKILNGAVIAELPFERCITPRLIVNSTALDRLGIDLSPQLAEWAHVIDTAVRNEGAKI
jgi:putative tryptophan/tyrosine transport system substrate-binding protein